MTRFRFNVEYQIKGQAKKKHSWTEEGSSVFEALDNSENPLKSAEQNINAEDIRFLKMEARRV